MTNQAKKKRKNLEDKEQIALMQWAAFQKYNDEKVADFLHHSPNGGSRNAIEAAKFKRMGVKAGFPDLFLFVPNGLFFGLFIELKAKGGRVTENQSIVMQRLTEQGYCCKVCYGAEQAIDEIKSYLDLQHESTT